MITSTAQPNEPMVTDKNKNELVLGLPPVNTRRWVSRRKTAVVRAIRGGVISREEAYERYMLSPEELAAWETAFDQYGIRGLRATHLQDHRNAALGNRRGDVRPLGKRSALREDR